MPVMDLLEESGALREDAQLTVLTVMLFPNSIERQNELYITALANTIAARGAGFDWGPLGPEMIKFLLGVKPVEEQLNDLQPRFHSGLLVGEVLAYTCCQAQNDPGSASRNKAQALQRMNLDAAAKEHPTLKLAKSERSQNHRWKEFSAAAHLWAGLYLLSRDGSPESDRHDLRILRDGSDALVRLLGFAEFFRKIGETFVAANQRPTVKSPATSVLNPDETWKCPDNLVVPEVKLELLFDEDVSWLLGQYNYAELYGIK